MCNRYRAAGVESLVSYARDVLGVEWDLGDPRYNIAPNQVAPIFVKDESARTVATSARWNLIPHFETTPRGEYLRTNARAEEVFTKPSYRQPLQQRRCLVPADGFYEWEHLLEGRVKRPWAFELPDRRPFCLAGLWERGSESRPPTFTILTTTPNALVAKIHTRMPVMLSDPDAPRWLGPGPITREELAEFARPYPAERMVTHRVSSALNSVRNDTAEAAAPATDNEPSIPTQGELF